MLAQLEGADYVVKSVGTREKRRNPVAPFITSTLQQESSRKLRFSVKRTMILAQRLYEGIELGKEGAVGLITYMRTDSTRISEDALQEARAYIAVKFGPEFLPESANIYKSKKDAQDAHEAIRPTSMEYSPDDVAKYLAEDELKLYRLIWNRFVASQMAPAVFDQTTIDISARGKDASEYLFRATGSVLKFGGFLKIYEEGKDQSDEEDEEVKHKLPAVAEGEHLKLRGLLPEQHFTEPPPRYNEATLVKKLEADGVGRPSTYASILSTIQEREYVKKEGGRYYTCKISRNFYDSKGIDLMTWPPFSPDLNSTENVWGIMKSDILLRNPTTLNALKQFIQEEWDAISLTTLRKLALSMESRLDQLKIAKGHQIYY